MTLQLLVDDLQWLCIGFGKDLLTVNISLVVNLGHFHCLLVYFLVYFVLLNIIEKCEFELQVHRIIDFILLKNVILVS